jgi:hypothetical protein
VSIVHVALALALMAKKIEPGLCVTRPPPTAYKPLFIAPTSIPTLVVEPDGTMITLLLVTAFVVVPAIAGAVKVAVPLVVPSRPRTPFVPTAPMLNCGTLEREHPVPQIIAAVVFVPDVKPENGAALAVPTCCVLAS